MYKFDLAYTVVRGNKPGARIGIVKYNESGYYATDLDRPTMTEEEVKETVAYLNERLDIPADVVQAMEYASCFGWSAPIAEPAHRYFRTETIPAFRF